MTNPHAKAVEAARQVLFDWLFIGAVGYPGSDSLSKDAITAYLAAMRAEGWVMVRDVGMSKHDNLGWNACRAAMLKGAGDGQG